MANTIKLKTGSGSDPSASDLVVGELAIRTDSGKIFLKKDNGAVAEVSGGGGIDDGDKGDITVSNGGDTFTIDNGVVTSAKIADDTIVNADINASAAISGSKITPSFGSQNVNTSGNYTCSGTTFTFSNNSGGKIRFLDTNNNPDYNIESNPGEFEIYQSSDDPIIKINTDKHIDLNYNVDCAAGIDVTGNISVSGTVDGVDIAARNTLFGGLTSSSGVLTNGVTGTTQGASDNTTKVATTAYVTTAISNLINGAPSALDTLNELAAAMNDDAAFSTTVTNSLATKMPLAGGQFTGNITFSGSQTVDGRDLSVDGSKLDGIESGATADQTASEILTLIKTVDGAGSGLDADTLDGISSASFLRSDASDNMSQNLTLSLDDSDVLNFTANSTNDNRGIAFNSKTALSADYNDGYLRLNNNQEFANGVYTPLAMRADGGFFVNGTALGIDGSGNFIGGTIATTGTCLIGGTYSNNAYNSVSSTRLLFGGGNDQANYHIGTNLENYGGNYTKLDLRWHTGIRMGAQAGYGGVRFFTNEDVTTVLFSVGKGDGNVRVESGELYHNTSGTSDKYWREGNDGSGSGLDSDTLDGVQGSSYLRSDANDTYTGTLSLAGHIVSDGDSRSVKLMGGTTNSQPFLGVGEQNQYGMKIRWDSGSNIEFDGFWSTSVDGTRNRDLGDINVNTSTWNFPSGVLINGSTAWHAGNDGSGSGLDADTLDGVNSTSFLRSDADDETTGYFTINKNITSTNYYSTTHLECRATSGTAIIGLHRAGYSHVGIGHSAGNQLFFHMNAGTSYLNSNAGTIWGSGNDGSGSGLDADTLDGFTLSASGNRFGVVPHVHTDGVVEFGRYLDFHETDGSTGDFNFRIYAQGNALHTGGGTVYGFSDINHKKNITKITDPLTKIKEISGYTFNWISNNNSGGGCIAQEVETILPELISTVSDGDLPDGTNNDGKYLNYDGVIGLLVETCKEMLTKITNLETEVNNLKSS